MRGRARPGTQNPFAVPPRSRPSIGRRRTARARLLGSLIGCVLALAAPDANALVFGSQATEPTEERPKAFPYWDYVTQRRYEGPTVIYLGGGHALTARHVGHGEIFLEDRIIKPLRGGQHTILNPNGKTADAMVFELDRDVPVPDWPLLPIATEPPRRGEEVLLVGFGRGRDRVVEFDADGESRFAFLWSDRGEKRWGTNRIASGVETITQGTLVSRSFVLVFDPPGSPGATRYEAQAAVGDSGGGAFVYRDGSWQLLGLMVSVSGDARVPGRGSAYGDRTFVVDLTTYRDEILRWTRASCSNERDDDGDERVDYPADPGCDSPFDRDERDGSLYADTTLWIAVGATLFAVALGLLGMRVHRRRQA